jgi:hypothetical protein
MTCIICFSKGEGHHLRTRKSGGCDSVWNLMPLCRLHHSNVHQIGMNTFAKKYPVVKDWLISHGWDFNVVKNKWTRY